MRETMREFLARGARRRGPAGTATTLTQRHPPSSCRSGYGSGVSGYLDAATAVPLHPTARATLEAAMEDGWADPDRIYREGRRARQLLDGARAAVAAAVGAHPDEVTFCSSGTTAAHAAVLGGAAGRRRTGSRLVVSAVEHSSVLAAVRHHDDAGGTAVLVGVDRLGRVDASSYLSGLTEDTALAVLQSANHEVGTVQ